MWQKWNGIMWVEKHENPRYYIIIDSFNFSLFPNLTPFYPNVTRILTFCYLFNLSVKSRVPLPNISGNIC